MKTLYIDDGHGIETAGKRTPVFPVGHELAGQQIRENIFNAAVAKRLGQLAESQGYRVVMTAPEDSDVPLSVRSKRANLDMKSIGFRKVDTVFLSVHYNALNGKWDSKAGGIEVYHYPGSTEGIRLAKAVHDELIKGTSQVDRGIKEADFHVLRETIMPAILIEAGFMDCLEEAERMLVPDFQDEVAKEIMDGVNKYFGIESCANCHALNNQIEMLQFERDALMARLNKIADIAKGE